MIPEPPLPPTLGFGRIATSAGNAYIDIIASTHGNMPMASLNIRNLPNPVHAALRVRAARHGNSMEAEARSIIAAAVEDPGALEPEPSFEQQALSVRETLGVYLTPNRGDSIVDEFIAERREQARREAQD